VSQNEKINKWKLVREQYLPLFVQLLKNVDEKAKPEFKSFGETYSKALDIFVGN
jgi:hypothetical protein